MRERKRAILCHSDNLGRVSIPESTLNAENRPKNGQIGAVVETGVTPAVAVVRNGDGTCHEKFSQYFLKIAP